MKDIAINEGNDSIEIENPSCWYRYGFVREKEDRTVVKMYNEDRTFAKSIIMPTVYYPVEGSGKQKVFNYDNTEVLTDKVVMKIFDSIKYQIGHCYQNTERLVEKLKENGYDAKSYVGWLFISPTLFPVHHCWCVLNDTILLDLADEFTLLDAKKSEFIAPGLSIEESRNALVNFTAYTQNLSNSERCAPLGQPSANLYYVGCECSPEQGKVIYQNLIKEFPDHECQKNVDQNGRNRTQQLLHTKGLMP